MTREEAIKILEYPVKKWSMEWDEREDGLSYYEALDLAISALRQQDHFREATKKVEPLTLDELRKMDGEPVWVVWPDGRIKSQWFIISSTFWIEMFQEWDGTLSKDYGKTWLAYRQKPEEGTV